MNREVKFKDKIRLSYHGRSSHSWKAKKHADAFKWNDNVKLSCKILFTFVGSASSLWARPMEGFGPKEFFFLKVAKHEK